MISFFLVLSRQPSWRHVAGDLGGKRASSYKITAKWIERYYWICYWRRFAIGGTNWYFVLLLKPQRSPRRAPRPECPPCPRPRPTDTPPLWTYRLGLFIFFLCKYGFISDELYLCGNRFSEISLFIAPHMTIVLLFYFTTKVLGFTKMKENSNI